MIIIRLLVKYFGENIGHTFALKTFKMAEVNTDKLVRVYL